MKNRQVAMRCPAFGEGISLLEVDALFAHPVREASDVD
jgi:hypothetical protein